MIKGNKTAIIERAKYLTLFGAVMCFYVLFLTVFFVPFLIFASFEQYKKTRRSCDFTPKERVRLRYDKQQREEYKRTGKKYVVPHGPDWR